MSKIFCLHVIHQVWEIFSHYFFEYFSSPPSFFLFFWDANNTNVKSFVIVLQAPAALFIDFQSFTSLLFLLHNFYCSVLKFTNGSLCPFHSAVELIYMFCVFFYVLKFSFHYYIFCIFHEIFYFFLLSSMFKIAHSGILLLYALKAVT